MTGPPPLGRNGGIWRTIKTELKNSIIEPKIMVQATHFSMYNLSKSAWRDWSQIEGDITHLSKDIRYYFGAQSDVFVDSGGFQLLYKDAISLEKWNLKVSPEDIFELQMMYSPNRISSLDFPLNPKLKLDLVESSMKRSITNAIWLAKNLDSYYPNQKGYLVIHGRTPGEVELYLEKLKKEIPVSQLRNENIGFALGSQVPLSGNYELITNNIMVTDSWLNKMGLNDSSLHIFGVGESIIGQVAKFITRELSFDNSTYVQKAYRYRIYNPKSGHYEIFDPGKMPDCNCEACKLLDNLGRDVIYKTIYGKSFSYTKFNEEKIYKSKILGLVAIHNLFYWKQRAFKESISHIRKEHPAQIDFNTLTNIGNLNRFPNFSAHYNFPLEKFKARGKTVIFIPCSKSRPYSESRSHQTLIKSLKNAGFEEGVDYDRITLSGLYGPVHWENERDENIMSYDFSLGNSLVNNEHKQELKYKMALVLDYIRNKYKRTIGYFPSSSYSKVFGTVLLNHGGIVCDTVNDIIKAMINGGIRHDGEE